jgi:Fic family protein
MKKPQEAPKFSVMLEKMVSKPQDLQKLMGKSFGHALSKKYLHWDDLQYREPPENLSREEWWFLLKLNRQGTRKFVPPLADKGEERFSFAAVEPIPERLHEIDMQAGGLVQMPEQVTNRETKDAYYVSSLMEEAITSSQLEGATTTRKIAKEMLRTGRQPRDRSERMILNNFLTMKRIGTLKNEPLSKELIFEIHRLVTSETLDDPTAAGRFRRTDEKIAVYDQADRLLHEPPPASVLDSRVQRICDFANETKGVFVHPVIKSIILHFMLGYEHPFVDGNGRTARALFYWSMLRHNYWLAEFISISQIVLNAPAKYGRAYLFTETDEGDLTYFILYHLKIITRAIVSLHEYIARKTAEIQRFETELRGIELLNSRQRALVRHAVRHPGTRYTIEEHRHSNNIAYETARSDLLDLSRRDLFVQSREGKRWVFTAQPQLMGRLAAIGTSGSAALS